VKRGSLKAHLSALGLFGAFMASNAGVVPIEVSGAMLVAPELAALEAFNTHHCHLQQVTVHRAELRFETVEFSYQAVDGDRPIYDELVYDGWPAPRASLPAAQVCGSP
jgi:hypothetical protein